MKTWLETRQTAQGETYYWRLGPLSVTPERFSNGKIIGFNWGFSWLGLTGSVTKTAPW